MTIMFMVKSVFDLFMISVILLEWLVWSVGSQVV
jgi:hypothetical protein